MKKVISALIICVFCIYALCSCGTEFADDYEIASFDGESRIEISAETTSGGEISNESNASFLVKDRKYTFKENNFVILDVTNETGADYGITIAMTYFDETGNVLGTEEKNFGCFSAGFQNNFCFAPEYDFDKYSYTLTADEYTGQYYENKVEVKGLQLLESLTTPGAPYMEYEGSGFERFEKYPSILFSYTYSNTADVLIYVPTTFVLFNSKDEVVAIINHIATIEPGWELEDDYNAVPLFITSKEKLVWPEKYQGEIKIVTCFRNVTTEQPK